MPHTTDEIIDINAVRDDDQLVERISAGQPVPDNELNTKLVAWRNDVQ